MNLNDIDSLGQNNFPKWEKLEASLSTIFSNRYYTNHGPFTQKLESTVEELLEVKHAIAMTNDAIALVISAKALNLSGKVICSPFISPSALNSLYWNNLTPIVCEVDEQTLAIKTSTIEHYIDDEVSAILGNHLMMEADEAKALQEIAKKNNIKLYFDARSSFGEKLNNVKIGSFGALEVFSFSQSELINGAESAIVCTNDDELAKKIRNIRSSYGAREVVSVPITGNGRISEAQAAIALLSIEDMDENRERNIRQHAYYAQCFSQMKGFNIVNSSDNEDKNYSSIVVKVENLTLSPNLKNIKITSPFSHGINHNFQNKVIEHNLNNSLFINVPVGNHIDKIKIDEICKTLEKASIQK